MWLWRPRGSPASFSAMPPPSKMNRHMTLPPQWPAWRCHLSATFFITTFWLCLLLLPWYPPPTLLRFPYCFHVPVPSRFRPHNPPLCISTSCPCPAHHNSVQWIRNSPSFMRFIYKTVVFSKVEIDFLEMRVTQMSMETIRSLEMEKIQTGFTPHVVGRPKPP